MSPVLPLHRHWRGVFGALLLALGLLVPPGSSLASSAPAFRVRPAEYSSPGFRDLAEQLQREAVLHQLADRLNGLFKVGRSVHLRFAECGQANAYYQPDRREVRVCFELLQLFADVLAGQVDDEDQLIAALFGALRFVVLHEVGHALVDVLAIPITGREEDAVDQLSVWLLLDGVDDSTAVLSAAAAFQANAQLSEADFSSDHALDQQRYFNMICWVYGSDPAGFADLPADWALPEARAAVCADEYAQLQRSWRRLLQAHLKPRSAATAAAPGMP